MQQRINILHPLEGISADTEIPSRFTFPFHYTPHPLTLAAAHQLQDYLALRTDWKEEMEKGKMFGVLIVRTPEQGMGFLAAFSGNLAGSNQHEYFVPPVYDMLLPDGFFKKEEANISSINREIKTIEESEEFIRAQNGLTTIQQKAKALIASARLQLKDEKRKRDELRRQHPSEEEKREMIRQSQYQKAELKRLEVQLNQEIAEKKGAVEAFEHRIEVLKEERKTRSAALQMKLFSQFILLNAKGETKDLCEIFKNTRQGIPPAGAGECALPKLLQYAYLHHYQPVAMGEFWWGQSPKDEIRRQGQFYPSCKSKCEPILKHMLVGLQVEENPLLINRHKDTQLEIVYEDDWLLVVNKPEGMLSVPGKDGLQSVYQYIKDNYPKADGPLIVHRLDMSTSGLLLIAKTKLVHEKLQQQFETRNVDKTYIAILEGIPTHSEGIIKLPLCPDIDNRPQQMVSYELGKPAVTIYKVIETVNRQTRIELHPITGRTHQLRVHMAHPDGLNCPIVGDELYGTSGNRLMLHAERLSFIHPVNGQRLKVTAPAPF